ncbi:coiled-coil domain-containing protein 71 [Discoglossus pictus]
MNVEEDHMEQKAVHSWSRLSSAGERALEEALRVFNPMSKDLTDTETQLVTFLQGLREEGYQPTILRSKDVYGYNSKTADAPPKKKCTPKMPTVSVSSKTQSKSSSNKVPSASVAISVNSTKVNSKHSPTGSTNLLLRSLSGADKSKHSTVGFPSSMYPGVYPAMRLSVVLEALVPFKTSVSPLEAKLKQHSVVASKKQTSKTKRTIAASEHNTKTLSCLIKKIPSSGNHGNPLNGKILKGPNGRVLKENNACTASGMNGKCNGVIQKKHNSEIKTNFDKEGQRKKNVDTSKKRKPMDDAQDAPPKKKIKMLVPLVRKSTLNIDKLNMLMSRVVKVDRLSSDDEVRRRAQKILQVNLSPVLRIHPLTHTVS